MENIKIKVPCKNKEHVNYVKDQWKKIIRKIKHVTNTEITYVICLEDLDKKEIKYLMDRKTAKELNIIPKQ